MAVTKKAPPPKKAIKPKPKPKPASNKPSTRKKSIAELELEITLPTEKSKPNTDFFHFSRLIYGDRKIGKTTLASAFPDTFIMSFEPGTEALSVLGATIPNWALAEAYKNKIIREQAYKHVVIDTGAIAYDRCLEHVCNENDCAHPNDKNDYGATWSKIKTTFQRFHNDLLTNGIGLTVICHQRLKTITSLSGVEYDIIEPDLTGVALQFYHGALDTICYYNFVGKERYLTIRGNEIITAGTRCKSNFLTPKGERVIHIPLGNDEYEAFDNVKKAFNNKQHKSYSNLK